MNINIFGQRDLIFGKTELIFLQGCELSLVGGRYRAYIDRLYSLLGFGFS